MILSIKAQILAKALNMGTEALNGAALTLKAPMKLQKRGFEAKIIIGEKENSPIPNRQLKTCLLESRQWLLALTQGQSFHDISQRHHRSEQYIKQRIKLALVSPNLQKAIISGAHPPHWSILTFIKAPLPLLGTSKIS